MRGNVEQGEQERERTKDKAERVREADCGRESIRERKGGTNVVIWFDPPTHDPIMYPQKNISRQ